MKNKYVKIAVLAITIALIGMLSVTAQETDEVSIKLDFKQGPFDTGTGFGYNVGRWHSKGAINDGGLVLDEYSFDFPHMVSHYIMGGKTDLEYLIIDVELVSAEWISPWKLEFTGTWTVAGGTGIYDGAGGGGTATQIIVLSAAMNSADLDQTFGCPARSNHVVLEGTIQLS